MKWSLQQLFKNNGRPFYFEDVLNFTDRIKSIDDILNISQIKVNGRGINLFGDRYQFDLHIEGTLYLEDARTLEEVEYPIILDIVEFYDVNENDENDEDIRLIEKNTIDLTDAIWENILFEKPIRVVKEEIEVKS